MRTRASKQVFTKRPLYDAISVLKKYKSSYGVYYIHLLSKQFRSEDQNPAEHAQI